MALYKRENGVYYVNITIPGRRPFRRSTGTKDRKKAQEYHDRKKVEIWNALRLDLKPERSWDEAAYRWLLEKQGTASYPEYARQIAWWTKFLRGVALTDITRELVDETITKHLGHVSPRTKDTYVVPVRGVLYMARDEWGWIDHAPTFRTYLKRGSNKRVRWISPEQVQTLLKELPRHTRVAVLLTLATGLRMGNVLAIRWSDINLENRVIYIERTKNDDPLTTPLNDMALAILDALRGEHPEYVISYKGEPLKRVNTRAWRNALARAGIENFRWHDLRHTWASWLRQQGVPTWALQQLGGWRDPKMVDRYAHIQVDHLKPFATKLDTILDTAMLEGGCTNLVKRR